MAGRPPEGGDPAKRKRERERYRNMSEGERRASVARRDPDKQREADNRRYARDPGKRDALRARLRAAEGRGKDWAREVARKAAEGRSKACSRCGSKRDVQLHHPDHGKPLKVVPLCATCHGSTRRTDDARA